MEILNVGAQANDRTGDRGRDAFIKIKNNFSELDNRMPVSGKYTGITDDYELEDWVPDGVYLLERITIKNNTENMGQLSAGTQEGANNLFSQKIINPMGGPDTINPEGWTSISTDLIVSSTSPVSLFFNTSQEGDEWNMMSVDIYITLRKLE